MDGKAGVKTLFRQYIRTTITTTTTTVDVNSTGPQMWHQQRNVGMLLLSILRAFFLHQPQNGHEQIKIICSMHFKYMMGLLIGAVHQ